MLPDRMMPNHVLVTLDAVGGVWRYALDLASGLGREGVRTTLLCFGPPPSAGRAAEVEATTTARLVWSERPLDWMARPEDDLDGIAREIEQVAEREGADLLHLNLPSQAVGISHERPIVVASHSSLATWWEAMRREPLPEDWRIAHERNRRGFANADIIVAPSGSHAEAVERAYGVEDVEVVYNSAAPDLGAPLAKEPFALAAGRWWDEAKNASALEAAAACASTPIRLAGPVRAPNGEEFRIRAAVELGEIPARELRDTMRRAAIFASPARYEPFGLAVLEAAMSECALVLADIPTFREIWDGAAIFVPADEPAALAAAIDFLAADPEQARGWGARAAERARPYTNEAQIDEMLRLYARAGAAFTARSAPPARIL
jgi:glycosyltransferase involved in cell wall biosynthesis